MLHTYYGDEAITPDFVVKPTPRTAALLKNYGLTFRSDSYGFRILYAGFEDGEPVHPLEDMEDGETLSFTLHLQNQSFFHFTELAGVVLRNQLLVYDSLARTTEANTDYHGNLRYILDAPTSYAIKPSIFSTTYSLTGNPYSGSLRFKDSDGNTVLEVESIRTQDDVFNAKVDLSAEDPGVYSMEKMNNGSPEGPPELFYLDDSISANSTFGVIRLVKETLWETLQDDNVAASPDEEIGMVVKFDHRVAQWKYKVVFKFTEYSGDATDYVISDGLSTVVDDDRYNTGLIGDKFFFKAETSAGKFNGYDALDFNSVDDAPSPNPKDYPLFRESKYDLNLLKEGVNLLTHLPNPGTQSYVPEVIIYV